MSDTIPVIIDLFNNKITIPDNYINDFIKESGTFNIDINNIEKLINVLNDFRKRFEADNIDINTIYISTKDNDMTTSGEQTMNMKNNDMNKKNKSFINLFVIRTNTFNCAFMYFSGNIDLKYFRILGVSDKLYNFYIIRSKNVYTLSMRDNIITYSGLPIDIYMSKYSDKYCVKPICDTCNYRPYIIALIISVVLIIIMLIKIIYDKSSN
jgi:hypothetical protein